MDFHMKYIICTKLMTVKWDMQQKHGSPPRVMRNSGSYFDWNVMTTMHFTALSMVDISYFVDATHQWQHAAWKQRDVKWSEKDMGGKCSVGKGEVRWTAAKPRLKITYMHHGRMEMYVQDYKMQRWWGQLRGGGEWTQQPTLVRYRILAAWRRPGRTTGY